MRIIIVLAILFSSNFAYCSEDLFTSLTQGQVAEYSNKLLQCFKKPETLMPMSLLQEPLLEQASIPLNLPKTEEVPQMLGNSVNQATDPIAIEQTQDYPFGMFSIYPNDIVEGNPKAKVVVVEYSAPTCPHCAYFNKSVYPELKKRYIDTNKIAYVIREFVANKQDLEASLLLRCSKKHQRGQLEKLRSVLYQQQESWAYNKNHRDILTNIGQLAGISIEQYHACLADSELTEFLANNARGIAMNRDFMGTPAFFVNGLMHRGPYTEKALAQSIEAALKAAGAEPAKNSK